MTQVYFIIILFISFSLWIYFFEQAKGHEREKIKKLGKKRQATIIERKLYVSMWSLKHSLWRDSEYFYICEDRISKTRYGSENTLLEYRPGYEVDIFVLSPKRYWVDLLSARKGKSSEQKILDMEFTKKLERIEGIKTSKSIFLVGVYFIAVICSGFVFGTLMRITLLNGPDFGGFIADTLFGGVLYGSAWLFITEWRKPKK